KDDGRGFDVDNVQREASNRKCMGLLGMKERVMLVGGDIEVESAPDCGTEVRVYLPIQTEGRL
ncbi:MAG TPA: ATP-binding protein, partial [Acidobacteriota bacterium]